MEKYLFYLKFCILSSKAINSTFVVPEKRSAIIYLFVFNICEHLTYMFSCRFSCKTIKHTLSSALRPLTTSLRTCLLLFNLETPHMLVFQTWSSSYPSLIVYKPCYLSLCSSDSKNNCGTLLLASVLLKTVFLHFL